MTKEAIIEKAAARNIILSEEAAEQYVNLSEEELENLAVSGGCGGGSSTEPAVSSKIIPDPVAQIKTCPFYERESYYPNKSEYNNSCDSCKYKSFTVKMTGTAYYCNNKDAFVFIP
ncbi:MAG: hypothetical protein LBL98_08005 [Ruminococcus sp.]|jgi:hypothetical protein|nr:hypothetical protein [Ruminococcus sp.]